MLKTSVRYNIIKVWCTCEMYGYSREAGGWILLILFIQNWVFLYSWHLMYICRAFVYKKQRQGQYIWILLWQYKPNKSNFYQTYKSDTTYSPQVRNISRWADSSQRRQQHKSEQESFSHDASIIIQEWMEAWLIEYYSQHMGAPDISHE